MFENTLTYKNALDNAILQSDIVAIFDNLLTISVEEWASDIHIEPMENYSRIRIRIDWLLQELVQYPKTLHESIISKFKIESGQMRPDEKRIPQDARVSNVTLTWKELDLRANTLPTVWWEKLVMRIVDKSKKTPQLEELWLEWRNKRIIFNELAYPNWILLNTWPTWSWKTATLYACLNYINKPEVNITTFEDPVENKMEWLNQSQVRSDVWFTFANWLRSALRQDPDIIMVWEIRDAETLEMAMEAALTWHLVFSTIHTNSAVETISRVLNLWAKAYMVAWTFNLVIAQRLARKNCTQCCAEVDIKDDIRRRHAKKAFMNFDKELLKKELHDRWVTKEQWSKFMIEWKMMKWTGKVNWEKCSLCGWSGYKWRIWLFELMDYNDEIKKMLMEWRSNMEIEQVALQNWMINLERDGIFKVIKWIVDLDEAYKFVKIKDI